MATKSLAVTDSSPTAIPLAKRDTALSVSLWLAVILPVAIAAIYAVILIFIPRDQLQWFHGETGPVEIITALVFLAAGILALVMALRIKKIDPLTPSYIIAAYLFIAVVSTFMLLEEISYGQHFLGFSSPEIFAENNKQGEMNLHNLFNDKPSSTLRSIANVGLPVFGIVLPILVATQPWGYRRRNWSWYLLPRWELFVWVIFSMLVSPIRKMGNFSEGYDHPWRGTFSEFKEMLWAMTGLILLIALTRRLFILARKTPVVEATQATPAGPVGKDDCMQA